MPNPLSAMARIAAVIRVLLPGRRPAHRMNRETRRRSRIQLRGNR